MKREYSACIQRNKNKYDVTIQRIVVPRQENNFPKFSYRTQTVFGKRKDCTKQQSEKTKVQELKLKDLQYFKKRKQEQFDQYHKKLKEYLDEGKTYERRFFRDYYKSNREYFVPRSAWKEIYKQEIQETNNKIVNDLMKQEIEEKQKEEHLKFLSKKKQERKEEDRMEREYKKEVMERFHQGEQQYFNNLESVKKNGETRFQSSLALKDSYYYDHLFHPDENFVNYRDLKFERKNIFTPQEQAYEEQLEKWKFDHELKSQTKIEIAQHKPLKSLSQSEQEYWLYIKTGQKDKIQFLLIIQPELLSLKDQKQMSGLHWAILRDYTSLAKFLINRGLSYLEEDSLGRSGKSLAQQKNNKKLNDFIKSLELNKIQRRDK